MKLPGIITLIVIIALIVCCALTAVPLFKWLQQHQLITFQTGKIGIPWLIAHKTNIRFVTIIINQGMVLGFLFAYLITSPKGKGNTLKEWEADFNLWMVSSLLFLNMTFSSRSSLDEGALNMLFTIPLLLLIVYYGRKPLYWLYFHEPRSWRTISSLICYMTAPLLATVGVFTQAYSPWLLFTLVAGALIPMIYLGYGCAGMLWVLLRRRYRTQY